MKWRDVLLIILFWLVLFAVLAFIAWGIFTYYSFLEMNPAIFITLAGVSLAGAALLYRSGINSNQREENKIKAKKLREFTPLESRGAVYLFLAFCWFLSGLIVYAVFDLFRYTCPICHLLAIVSASIFIFCGSFFLYAGAGDLLRAITSHSRAGVIRSILGDKIWHYTVYKIDDLMLRLGDWMTKGHFKQE